MCIQSVKETQILVYVWIRLPPKFHKYQWQIKRIIRCKYWKKNNFCSNVNKTNDYNEKWNNRGVAKQRRTKGWIGKIRIELHSSVIQNNFEPALIILHSHHNRTKYKQTTPCTDTQLFLYCECSVFSSHTAHIFCFDHRNA